VIFTLRVLPNENVARQYVNTPPGDWDKSQKEGLFETLETFLHAIIGPTSHWAGLVFKKAIYLQGRYNVYRHTDMSRPYFEIGSTKCSKLDFNLPKSKIPFLKAS